mgnify:FL=1
MSWEDWKAHTLETQFNPRAELGAKTDDILAIWVAKSKGARSHLPGHFDIAYGDHPLMRFDYHPTGSDAPIIINIHGGYWRALDKSAMQHHMADLLRSGFSTANLNYPLCPEISLTDIVGSLERALDKLVELVARDTPDPKFILFGHSAGAHLAAHLSHHPHLQDRLVGIVALTGIYETEVVRHIAVNDDIRMTPQEAERWCVITNLPVVGPQYYIVVGGDEPSGWIDQSWQLADALSKRGERLKFRVVQAANHFDLVDKLCNSDTPDGFQLHEWMLNLID